MDAAVSETSYTVRAGSFEGPLELLLNLVESRKLFINEIALAAVTDEYLRAMRGRTGDLAEATSFLSVAATLILIKSRSLLPGFLVTKEEEKDIVDLESRLALYAVIREIGAEISVRYGATVIRLPRERELFSSVFAPDPKLTQDSLAAAALDCLGRIPKEEALPEVRVRKVISIDEMLTSLTERIATAARVSFRDWQKSVVGADRDTIKNNVIVSFLAMLELVRQGMLDAIQGADFEDIELSTVEQDVLG